MRDQFLRDRTLGEGRLTREQEIKRRAQAVNVGANVGGTAVEGLLGRDVIRCANQSVIRVSRILRLVVKESGQTHVEQFDQAAAINQNVARLNIAMDEFGSAM